MVTGFLRGGRAPSLQKEWSYTSSPPVKLHACCSAKFTRCVELLKVLFVMPKLPGPGPDTHSSEQEALRVSSSSSAKCCDITFIQAAAFSYCIIRNGSITRCCIKAWHFQKGNYLVANF